MEINLHDGVRAVDAAVGGKEKKTASAEGKGVSAGAMCTGKKPRVESKKSTKATGKKGNQDVKGKMASAGNKGKGEKAMKGTKASAGEKEKEEKEEKGKGREYGRSSVWNST